MGRFIHRIVTLTPLVWFFQIWSVGPHKNAHGDEEYLTHIKTYAGEPPLNSAAIVPGKPYVRFGPTLPSSPLGLTLTHFSDVSTGRHGRWTGSDERDDDWRTARSL